MKKKLEKIEVDIQKRQKRIRQLNARISTVTRKENAKRRQIIGKAIEDTLGVGKLSQEELDYLVKWFTVPRNFSDGETLSLASWLAADITNLRETAKQTAPSDEK